MSVILMSEATWLVSQDPARMLAHFAGDNHYPPRFPTPHAPSDRKLRLFACACCRSVWHLLTDERSRRAVEVAERYADGLATEDERWQAHQASRAGHNGITLSEGSIRAWECSVKLFRAGTFFCSLVPNAAQAALLRDICGNPWRPVTLPPGPPMPPRKCGCGRGRHKNRRQRHNGCAACNGEGVVSEPGPCPWLTPTVLALAQAAYRERVGRCPDCGRKWNPHTHDRCAGSDNPIQDGTLDNDRLVILADALEDAGCADQAILKHLQGFEVCTSSKCKLVPGKSGSRYQQANHDCTLCKGTGWAPLRGPHVRGCHVLDLFLGKE